MAAELKHAARARNRPSLGLLAACASIALVMPGAAARAERQDSGPGVAEITSAIGRGIVAVQEGVVSWYGAQFHNRKTASGERFDKSALTMAHPSLPFGTVARVTNTSNGRSVVVRVNDRGPFVGKRIADLSQAAATEIGMLRRGLAKVRIEVLGDDEDEAAVVDEAAVMSASQDAGPKPFTSASAPAP